MLPPCFQLRQVSPSPGNLSALRSLIYSPVVGKESQQAGVRTDWWFGVRGQVDDPDFNGAKATPGRCGRTNGGIILLAAFQDIGGRDAEKWCDAAAVYQGRGPCQSALAILGSR